MPTPPKPDAAAGAVEPETLPPSGFELRLADGRAFVQVSGRPLGEGIVARRFRMEVPRIKFPFDLTGGADRFRDQRCLLRELELSVDAASIGRFTTALINLTGLAEGEVRVAARPGFLELEGRHPLSGWFTAKVAVEVTAEGASTDGLLGFFLYDFRLYQPGLVSAAEILHRFAANAKPPLIRRDPLSGGGLAADVLTPALRQLLVPRGFRVPETKGVALRRAHVLSGQLVLEFDEQPLPGASPVPGELLAREGQRSFSEVEALIAQGEITKARDSLRDLSQIEGHPFAAERFLQLLATDPASHDLAIDLCALLRRRSPRPAVALWVEGVIREANEEWGRAAACFLELAEHSLAERGLFSAALASRRAAELSIHGRDDLAATRAYALWESAVPNDVDALLGLAEIAERRRDIATALGALRRVSAFATDAQVSAKAHARLGKLLLASTGDVARARLHLDQALRQNPDDLQSLLALAQSCEQSGELVRAVRLLDRGARLARTTGDTTLAVQLLGRSATLWAEKLARPENALLRLREALALQPQEGQRANLLGSIAKLTRELGLRAEALDAQRAVTRAAAPGRARAEALLAEARMLSEDPASREAADQSIARALDESPTFVEAAVEWVRLRRGGSAADLSRALTVAANLVEPAERAELLVERGELELVNPALNGSARKSFAEALQAVPDHREALRLLADAAEREGDAAGACAAWLRLAEVSDDAGARAAYLRRLADLASRMPDSTAVMRILRSAAEKSDAPLPVLLRLLEVERRRGDPDAEAELVLRISSVADSIGESDLALSVLIEQLDRVDTPDEVERARPLLNRALQLAPQDGQVRSAAVRLFRLDGDLESLRPALEAYLQTAEAQPITRQLEIWRELAVVSLEIGQRREAIAAYEAIQTLDGQDVDAAEALVDLYTLEGDHDAQRRSLAGLAELLVRRGQAGLAALKLTELAELEAADAPATALDHLRRAVVLSQDSAERSIPLSALAAHAERTGHLALAVQNLTDLAALQQEPAPKAAALRRAAELSEEADLAKDLALRAHAADPELAWGNLFAALTALGRGDARRAQALAQIVEQQQQSETPDASIDPLLVQAVLAAAAQAAGDLAVEGRALHALQASDPDELAYAERRFEVLTQLGSVGPEIGELLERVADRLPASRAAEAYVEIADARAATGELGKSLTAYRAALARDGQSSRALVGVLRLLPLDAPERADLRSRLLALAPSTELMPAAARGALLLEEAVVVTARGGANARQLWEQAAELMPEDPRPLQGLAELLEAEGDALAGAQIQLRLAAKLPAASAGGALLGAAELLERAGDVQGAATALAQGLTRPLPKEFLAKGWSRLADLHGKLGDLDAERQALSELVQLVPPVERSRIHLRRADLLRRAGDREAERTALTQALLAGDQSVALLQRLRDASSALGDDEAVADTLERLIQAHAATPTAAAAIAFELAELALQKLGRPQRAEAAFRRALVFEPGHTAARSGLAEVLIGRGDSESVGRGLDLLIEGLAFVAEPDREQAAVALAERAAMALERPDVALRLLRGLLADGRLPPEGSVLGAELLYAAGATEEALRWMQDAIAVPNLGDERRSAIGLRRIELLGDLGRSQDALDSTLALLAEPPYAAALVDQLIGLIERGLRPDRARIEALARGVKQRTRAARLLTVDALGRLEQEPTAAAEELRAAIALEPTEERRATLRRALEASGDAGAVIDLLAAEAQAAAEGDDRDAELAAWRDLANAAQAAGRPVEEERALAALAARLERTAEGAAALHRLGELRLAAGDAPAALVSFLEAARSDYVEARERSEAIARRLGDGRSLAEVLELKLGAGTPGADPDRLTAFGELAELYRGPLAAPELAERTLRRALAEGAVPASGLETLVGMLRDEGRHRDAADLLLGRARELATSDAPAAVALFDQAASELEKLGDADAVVAVLREALEVDRSAPRLLAVADALHRRGQPVEAAAFDAELCEAESLPPFHVLDRHAAWLRGLSDARALAEFLEHHAQASQSPSGWLLEAADARRSLGEQDAEISDLREAFDLDPAQPKAFAGLVARGAVADAMAWATLLKRRAAAVPAEAGPLLRSAAEILVQDGRLADAAQLYDQALAHNPVDSLALVGRIQVTLLQGGDVAADVQALSGALSRGEVTDALAIEVLPGALTALAQAGAMEAARAVFACAGGLPLAVLESTTVLRLREQVAAALNDRSEQRHIRQLLFTRASESERPRALSSLLEVVEASDAEAPPLLRAAFDLEGTPHSVALTERLLRALEASGSPDQLAGFLEELLALDLLPTPTAAQRVGWARRAGELRWQNLGQHEAGAALFDRALAEAGSDPELLRTLTAPSLPAPTRVAALTALAELANSTERAELLLERAELADELSSDDAHRAWDAVLREGPGGPGYLEAIDRALARAMDEQRDADVAELLVAKADASEGGAIRAQLLERSAVLRETKLQDVDGALELYRRAAAEAGDVRWFTLLAEAYDRAGRLPEAAAALAVEVARREPGERRLERQRKLGLMLARDLGKHADAIPHLRSVAEAEPMGGQEQAAVLEALAESAQAVGDLELELKALSLMADREPGEPRSQAERRATILQELGRGAEAGELLAELARSAPGDAAIFARLAALLRERKVWRELSDLISRYLAANTSLEPEARLALIRERANLALDLGEGAEAEKLFREVLAAAPNDPDALAKLRRLVDGRGDQRELAKILATQLPLTADGEELASLALQLGGVELRLGDASAARDHLRLALATAERSANNYVTRVRLPLAQAEFAAGDPRAALDQAEAGLATGDGDRVALLAIATQSALQIPERLRALGYLKDWLDLVPGEAQAIAGLETLAHDPADPATAVAALAEHVTHEADPVRKARALRELADHRERAGDLPGMEVALRQAVHLDPDTEEGFGRLRSLLEAEGRYQDLAEQLRERARGTNDDVVRAASLSEQAEILRTQLHNPAGAAEAYQRSLEILPRASTSEGYAEALFALGQDELAAEHYRRALAGGGHLGEFFLLYRLGAIAARTGDRALALDHYQRACNANPSFLPAREALIELAEALGKSEVALTALRGMAGQLDASDFGDQIAEVQLRIAELEKRLLHFSAAAEALEKAAVLLPQDRRPLERLAALYQNAARWNDAVRVLERLAELSEGSEAASPLTAAAEISLDKLADMERAAQLFEGALQAAPGLEIAQRRLLEIATSLGNHARVLSLSEPLLARYPVGTQIDKLPVWLDELYVPIAQALQEAGRIEEAHRFLAYARQRAPQDLDLLGRQAALAKQSGRHGEESELEEELINKIVAQRPLEAATRLRALARRVLEQQDDVDRGRRLLERAAELAPARPEDRRLIADLWRRSDDPGQRNEALQTYLDLVRRDPALDIVLLRTLAATADELDRPELAQVVTGFMGSLGGMPSGLAPTLTPLPQEAWSIGDGEAGIDLAIRTLAPYLEPLFPSQLGRYGVTGSDRVGPGYAPELNQWIDPARESLGARPVDVYLAPALKGMSLENSHPPSLIVGAPAVQALGPGGLQWLLCQRLAMVELGFTLASKFSARDVVSLVSLVALFLSEDAPVPTGEKQRLKAFLGALGRSCPELVRQGLFDQNPRIARELAEFEPHRYLANATAKANQLALLVTGDLRSALAVVAYLDDTEGPKDRPWELPQGRDLVDWAFSDEHLWLRRRALGKAT